MKIIFTALLFTLSSLAFGGTRPEDELLPTNPDFQLVFEMARGKESDLSIVLKAIEKLKAHTEIETNWIHLFRGIVWDRQNESAKARTEFQFPIDFVLTHTSTSEDYRLAGRALSLVGRILLNKNELQKAYDIYFIEYQYLDKYGSFLELVFAAGGLHISSELMGNKKLFEHWLSKRIEIAQQIKQTEGLINIADAYLIMAHFRYNQGQFNEAMIDAQLSDQYWRKYDIQTDSDKGYFCWALFDLGTFFRDWAIDLKASGKNYFSEKVRALNYFTESLKVANERGESDPAKQDIKDQIAIVNAL